MNRRGMLQMVFGALTAALMPKAATTAAPTAPTVPTAPPIFLSGLTMPMPARRLELSDYGRIARIYTKGDQVFIEDDNYDVVYRFVDNEPSPWEESTPLPTAAADTASE